MYIDCPVLILPTFIINFITGGVKGILDGRNQVRAILLLSILYQLIVVYMCDYMVQ